MGVINNLRRDVERLNHQSEILTGRVNAALEVVEAQNTVIRNLALPFWKRLFKRTPQIVLKTIEPWKPEPEVTPKTVMGATVVGGIYEHK